MLHCDRGKTRWSVDLLLLDDPAYRIKVLRQERTSLLKTKTTREKARSRAKILPIATTLTAAFIKEIQKRLRDKKIGYNKDLSREIIKEARAGGKQVILTNKIPLDPITTTGRNRTGVLYSVAFGRGGGSRICPANT